VIGQLTVRPSTFFLSILVLIFITEFVIKISCGSSGTPVYGSSVVGIKFVVLIVLKNLKQTHLYSDGIQSTTKLETLMY
jgi:hypothetical protein